jgi:hypothetical protein
MPKQRKRCLAWGFFVCPEVFMPFKIFFFLNAFKIKQISSCFGTFHFSKTDKIFVTIYFNSNNVYCLI